MMLPVGEEADAVAAAEDLVEVVLEVVEGKILIDGLCDLKRGQQVERDAGDNAERAEADNGAEELIAVLFAREMQRLSVGGDNIERGDGSGEVAVVNA